MKLWLWRSRLLPSQKCQQKKKTKCRIMLHNWRIIHISIDVGHKLTLVKTKHKQKVLHCLTILSHFLICCYAILFRSNVLHGNVKDCMPVLTCTWFYMIFQTKSLCWFTLPNFKSTKPQYCPLIWMCLSICLQPCSKLAIFIGFTLLEWFCPHSSVQLVRLWFLSWMFLFV